MKVIGVVPARYASTRFPGKPLALIRGEPMVLHVLRRAQASRALDAVILATDDPRIAEVGRNGGFQVVMTDPNLPSGSDRCYAAVGDWDCDVVINIQGDEPLLDPQQLWALRAAFESRPSLDVATLARPLRPGDLESLATAKIVLDRSNYALYFSRAPIPYSRGSADGQMTGAVKHIGIYGYKKAFLAEFCAHGPCEIERLESLEQLRALYLGAKIHVSVLDTESWGVDTPEDVSRIEDMMKNQR